MKKICVVTGSRAEYGLLKPVLERILEDEKLLLQLIVTGMHMDDRCGLTYQEIMRDGFTINERVEMNLAADSSIGTCKSMGLGMISLAEAYERLQPDILLLLGDRYEIFTAASVAVISKIPIAHIHGGEITKGAFDDCMRHAITKMSYLHFTSTKEYRRRVIQLGEEPNRVYDVGALGVENIMKMPFLTRQELEEALNITLNKPFVIVTFHPVTLEMKSVAESLTPLLNALDFFEDINVIFTKSNSDTGGNRMNEMIEEYVAKNREKAQVFTSLGSIKYLNLMRHSLAIIGNSSSGIIEAPFLRVPTVNIGDRQMGRIKPCSVIDCDNSTISIIAAIQKALRFDWNEMKDINQYEYQETSYQIVNTIKQVLEEGIELKKEFYDIE